MQVQINLSKCPSTVGLTLGAKFCHGVFLSFSLGEAQALGPWGYKTLRLWLDHKMVDLLMCTGKIKDRQGQGNGLKMKTILNANMNNEL